jgi:hypothetical protein
MQKAVIYLLYKIGTNVKRTVVVLVLSVVLVLLLRSSTWLDAAYYNYVDHDAKRGATTVSADVFGDSFSRVEYLDQGWSAADSLWFYNITQGSDLLPYDFFIALEQVGSTDLFRLPENMNRLRYLPQKVTRSNPDALPVGMVADTYDGKKYMGFTCAACHSSQVNHKGVGIRIDGGPAGADMDGFMHELEASLSATLMDEAKRQRFATAVIEAGSYGSAEDVKDDLKTYLLRVQAYNFFNESRLKKDNTAIPYGYARLDAFGRIYNRVLEHVLNPEALRTVLTGTFSPEETDRLLEALQPVLSAEERDHLIEALTSLLSPEQRQMLRDKVFNPPNAPVSYPFLWDIPQHDYVQWNGIGANAGLGPIGRNAGEVIGVFGTLDWAEKDGWSVSSVINGQGFGPTHISFKSSVDVQNLRKIEDRLWSLTSPSWEEAAGRGLLPELDEAGKNRGERLFGKHCARCHSEINPTDPDRRVVARMDNLKVAGTDRTMARNSVDYAGFSGIVRNQYVGTDVGDVLLNTRAPVAAILTKATASVVATPDPDKWFFTRGSDWAINLAKGFFGNDIKPSVKAGSYKPDTTAEPFASLQAYKGRPLNGIWATAPYLHNGSVPTLYDLLLPATTRESDPPEMQYRPAKFMVGSRELDVRKVGFKHGENDYDGFLFDTSKPSNSNEGHEYQVRKFTDQDRWDLVEFLKSL